MEVEEMNEEHKEKSCNRLGKEFEGIVYDVKKAQMNMQRDADYSAKYRYRTQRYPEKEKYLRIQIQRSKGFIEDRKGKLRGKLVLMKTCDDYKKYKKLYKVL